MPLHRLCRFAVFEEFSARDLNIAAAHSRRLSLPAGRWLVRPGRDLSGSYFLDRGRVRLYEPDELVEGGSERARHPLYPGSRGVATLSAADLLQVDTESLTGLFEPASAATLPVYPIALLTEGWESRFLGTHIMQHLRPHHWQRILHNMKRLPLHSGDRIVREGEPGSEFYVLCAGAAEVRSAGRCLAHLQPGDFFGEDALIAGGSRNATVVMTSNGSVMALADDLFRSVVLPLTMPHTTGQRPLVPLRVGNPSNLRERLGKLERRCVYRVVGGSSRQRTLTAFILIQQGFLVGSVAQE